VGLSRFGHQVLQQKGSRAMNGQRPPHVKPPAHLSKSPPVPKPAPAKAAHETGGPKGLEPTRYNDWENNGIAWDF
jgi:hypothetical protein